MRPRADARAALERERAFLSEKATHRSLVIFVGAGVPANAGLPDWQKLVAPLAPQHARQAPWVLDAAPDDRADARRLRGLRRHPPSDGRLSPVALGHEDLPLHWLQPRGPKLPRHLQHHRSRAWTVPASGIPARG